jgi:hypothetical protein
VQVALPNMRRDVNLSDVLIMQASPVRSTHSHHTWEHVFDCSGQHGAGLHRFDKVFLAINRRPRPPWKWLFISCAANKPSHFGEPR